MDNIMKDNLLKDKNMGKEYINGQMVTFTMEIFRWIKGKDWEYIYGLIKVYIVGNGELIE